MEIKNLKILHMGTPCGIDTTPYFSWFLESQLNGTFQTAYSIIVKNMDETV